jgi:hypothetical protein
MAYAIAVFKWTNEDVEAVVDTSNGIYIGTNKGNVYFSTPAGVLTLMGNVGGCILDMALYSTSLYISIAGGKLVTMATS